MAESEKPAQVLPILFSGSCACKRITYDSKSMPTSSQACHCTTCRKLSGGPFQCFPDVKSKELTFYDNKERLRYEGLPKDSIGGITFLKFLDVGERAFCVDCYSPLAMRYKFQGDTFGLTLGTVDENTIRDERIKEALRPAAHIFVSQKAWWVDLRDGLPTHDRFTSPFEQEVEGWNGEKTE